MKYRSEIDGLRALAVIPVIFFHAGFEPFSGGFLGVDVFFVISGYLITTIIVEDLQKKQFSLLKFYERRARRILPALFLVTLVCIPFAWMWMTSSEMINFSESLIAVSLFASNILFWRESGYFGAVAEETPLLHTWSLAVEEQYYLFFPVFLLLIWRFRRQYLFLIISLLATISLLLSEWGWRNAFDANFYLLPTRAWELFAGSMAALIVKKRGVRANNWLSLVGLLAILISIVVYDKSTPFPSAYTLVPVIGVVLLIMYGAKQTFIAKFLSVRLFVGIGLISYSAYLWHQPLFAFARLYYRQPVSEWIFGFLIIVTFLLAFCSWKLIEQPFRNRGKVTITWFLRSTILFAIGFIIIGAIVIENNGFPLTEGGDQSIFKPKTTLTSDIWVIGDSHGRHLLHGLQNITSGRVSNYTALAGCIPLRNVDRYDYRFKKGRCAEIMNNYLDQVGETDPNAIVLLASMGPVNLQGTAFKNKGTDRVKGLGVTLITNPEIHDRWEVYELGLDNTFRELSNLENAKVVFVIDVPELGIDNGCRTDGKAIQNKYFTLIDSVANVSIENCFVSLADYEDRAEKYKSLVNTIASKYPKIDVFDPTELFCDESKCSGYVNGVGFLYHDIDHLSNSGSNYWANGLSKWISTTAQ